jgi:hypothetical protein
VRIGSRNQWIAVAGALPAMAVVAIAGCLAPSVRAYVALPADDTADRLAFALKWLLVPGLALLAGIVVAARRGFIADAIEGTRSPANYALEINLRYNQNTIEQTVLAIVAWTGLALALPRERLVLIPVMAGLFGLGRLTFWIGYLLHPLGRAFGMVLTALPTVIAFGWLLVHVLKT